MEATLARCATLADGLARAGGVRALAPLKEAVRGVARASASAAAAGEALSEALIQDLWGTACSIWNAASEAARTAAAATSEAGGDDPPAWTVDARAAACALLDAVPDKCLSASERAFRAKWWHAVGVSRAAGGCAEAAEAAFERACRDLPTLEAAAASAARAVVAASDGGNRLPPPALTDAADRAAGDAVDLLTDRAGTALSLGPGGGDAAGGLLARAAALAAAPGVSPGAAMRLGLRAVRARRRAAEALLLGRDARAGPVLADALAHLDALARSAAAVGAGAGAGAGGEGGGGADASAAADPGAPALLAAWREKVLRLSAFAHLDAAAPPDPAAALACARRAAAAAAEVAALGAGGRGGPAAAARPSPALGLAAARALAALGDADGAAAELAALTARPDAPTAMVLEAMAALAAGCGGPDGGGAASTAAVAAALASAAPALLARCEAEGPASVAGAAVDVVRTLLAPACGRAPGPAEEAAALGVASCDAAVAAFAAGGGGGGGAAGSDLASPLATARTAMHDLLWNAGAAAAGRGEAARARPLLVGAAALTGGDPAAASAAARALAKCALDCGDTEAALDHLDAADSVDGGAGGGGHLISTLLRFRAHLSRGGGGGGGGGPGAGAGAGAAPALACLRSLAAADGCDAAVLRVACQEAVDAACPAVATPSLSLLHAALVEAETAAAAAADGGGGGGPPSASTRPPDGAEAAVLRCLAAIVSGDASVAGRDGQRATGGGAGPADMAGPDALADLARVHATAAARLRALGPTRFFGGGEPGATAAAWFAGHAWNAAERVERDGIRAGQADEAAAATARVVASLFASAAAFIHAKQDGGGTVGSLVLPSGVPVPAPVWERLAFIHASAFGVLTAYVLAKANSNGDGGAAAVRETLNNAIGWLAAARAVPRPAHAHAEVAKLEDGLNVAATGLEATAAAAAGDAALAEAALGRLRGTDGAGLPLEDLVALAMGACNWAKWGAGGGGGIQATAGAGAGEEGEEEDARMIGDGPAVPPGRRPGDSQASVALHVASSVATLALERAEAVLAGQAGAGVAVAVAAEATTLLFDLAPSDDARVAAVTAAVRVATVARQTGPVVGGGGGGAAAFPPASAATLTAAAWNRGCLHVRWSRPAAAAALMGAAARLLPFCPKDLARRAGEMAATLARVEAQAAGAVETPGRAEGGRSGSGMAA